MIASDLIHRVTIQTSAETSDGHDGVVSTWANTARTRVPALVAPLSGRDLERARQVDPRASLRVTLRWWSTYVTDLAGGRARLVFHDGSIGDRTLEIVEPPQETDYRVVLSMTCRESA
ncbi:Bacteriophage SPP1, head-tail adaptor [uncultured Caudovirales phage]|uniref:Bacteriophage SPP1, head-tail adaptor n=1 Tax=uncultured Caudovirales phage TaxID=2100421 RepID=A0A6J5R576_9CAUD|nr:Bacteriophage SPP1, head-tail adaptor [uncultured Caudovirales phage]